MTEKMPKPLYFSGKGSAVDVDITSKGDRL